MTEEITSTRLLAPTNIDNSALTGLKSDTKKLFEQMKLILQA